MTREELGRKEWIIYVGKADNDELGLLIVHNDIIKAATDVIVPKAIKTK